MKRKSKNKKASTRKRTSRAPAPKAESKPRQLNLMVQVNEPKSIRKDLLEALREVIIFMQGYETFQKIQEEKMGTFAQLREDVKVLNSLVHDKLNKHLPKGKLAGLIQPKREAEPVEDEEIPASMPIARTAVRRPDPQNQELDDLEYQLKDIESRLKNLE